VLHHVVTGRATTEIEALSRGTPHIFTNLGAETRSPDGRRIGNLFDSTLGAWVHDAQALDLVGFARESAAVVLLAFWLTNGLRPLRVHPARLWLKRGLRCR